MLLGVVLGIIRGIYICINTYICIHTPPHHLGVLCTSFGVGALFNKPETLIPLRLPAFTYKTSQGWWTLSPSTKEKILINIDENTSNFPLQNWDMSWQEMPAKWATGCNVFTEMNGKLIPENTMSQHSIRLHPGGYSCVRWNIEAPG